MTKKIDDNNTVITPSNNYDAVRNSASDNLVFFKNDKSETGQKISAYLSTILDSVESLVPLMKNVEEKSHLYDFSEQVKGNGYTSWLKNAEVVVNRTLRILEEVTSRRNTYFFRKYHYLKEIKAYSEAMESMCVIMNYLLLMMSWSQSNNDLLITDHKPHFFDVISKENKFVNLFCFYGRLSCFQFCDSMATVLKALNILMATFSEVYYSDGFIIDPLLRGSKYWVDPEVRAKRIVNIAKYASVDFCKNYWFLGEVEIMQRIPSIMLPSLQVNKLIMLDPVPLVIENVYGKNIDIPIPSAHIGHAAIPLRLLSSSLRLGMETESSSKSGFKYPSDSLLFHCHGGGFVSQSSRSHENYLRQWAIDLDIPVLSVDYSLAPEAPYPRALEEIFYAYCWALANPSLLGTTAEKIVFAGDSAGANLNVALTMMCLEYGVRKPQGLFLAYIPIIMSLDPSPSRLFSLIDPLLPMGFLNGLVKAYTASPDVYAQSTDHERKLRRNVAKSKGFKAESPAENSPTNGEVDPKTPTEDEEGSKPLLMDRTCSSGVISRWITSLSTKLASLSPSPSFADDDELEKEVEQEQEFYVPVDSLVFDFQKDPYHSPYYASDSVLMNFPPVKILTTDMDLFLDECIVFGKRLKSLGVPVSLDILPGLNHGFLNFSMVSNEANEGAKACYVKIAELFDNINSADSSAATPAEECL
ncbi:hormone-sensitive lipase [Halyomorpha halys]|uniref:hormone-sensitive lipase n=1 Tax=Halyomorpha halys TaxID=286706 RepID=UPI0006D4DC33|nr:hormone-sensitive lipase [Halyomorpha halys]